MRALAARLSSLNGSKFDFESLLINYASADDASLETRCLKHCYTQHCRTYYHWSRGLPVADYLSSKRTPRPREFYLASHVAYADGL